MITLETLTRYATLNARADAVAARATASDTDSGAKNERRVAQKQLLDLRVSIREIEMEHPGIAEALTRVKRALSGEPEPAPKGTPPGWVPIAQAAVAGVIAGAVDRASNGIAGELSGAHRFDTLGRNEIATKMHECADGQVCIEIRYNLRDMKRSRDLLLDAIEGELP